MGACLVELEGIALERLLFYGGYDSDRSSLKRLAVVDRFSLLVSMATKVVSWV